MCVAHIEDLVVDKNCRNKNIGGILLNYAIEYAKQLNCYKIILDCKQELIPFYEKNKFYNSGICMRYDLSTNNIIIR